MSKRLHKVNFERLQGCYVENVHVKLHDAGKLLCWHDVAVATHLTVT